MTYRNDSIGTTIARRPNGPIFPSRCGCCARYFRPLFRRKASGPSLTATFSQRGSGLGLRFRPLLNFARRDFGDNGGADYVAWALLAFRASEH